MPLLNLKEHPQSSRLGLIFQAKRFNFSEEHAKQQLFSNFNYEPLMIF
jgi:hypothetical protein